MNLPIRSSQDGVTNCSDTSQSDTAANQPELAEVSSQVEPALAVSVIIPSVPITNESTTIAYRSQRIGSERSSEDITNSIIRDGGDAIQIINTATPSRIATPQLPSISSNEEDQSEEVGDHINSDGIPQSDSFLHDELRLARIESKNNDGCHFIPVNKLDELITRESIHEELEKRNIGPKKERLRIAKQIWEVPSLTKVTTRRKIFAVLALMEKVEAIIDFLLDEVYDSMLPFVFAKDQSVSSKSTKKPIKLFHKKTKWRQSEVDMFEKYQWEMMTPYFQLHIRGDQNPLRMAVDDRAVLPFIEIHNASEGGFSIVRQVKMHSAHYNSHEYGASDDETPYFAVKTLKFNADATVLNNQEVQSLIRLNNENNPNLIRLLVTFQHKAQLHLVFPWADGNLQDFWKIAYPDPNIPIRDVSLARWVIEQCLGLALGLKAIHHNCVDKSQAEEQGLPFDAPQKKHGRHGDFKPENILWFKQNGKSTPDSVTGTFKISDFGFADFHASMSASNIPTSDIPGMTPTYRAPEWNVKKSVASSYDIWSFGCVLLEFVEWYLRGWQGVEDFSGKRALDSVTEIPGYTEDNFFNLTYSGEKTTTASAKESVHVEIDALRRDDNSSDFILDLLDYIEDRILRMRPEQRADCDSVVEKLEGIYRRCSVDAQYCTERRQCIREKRMTGLSELAPSPKFVSMGFSAIPLAHARSASLASETASSSHLSAAFVRTEGIPSTQYKADGGSLPPTDPAESRLHTGTVDLDEASSADAQPELAMSQLMGLGIDQVYSRHLNNTVQLSTENVARYLEVPSTGANQSEPSDKTSKRNSTIINDKSYKTTPAVSDKNVLEGRHSSKAENSEPAQEERRSGSQRNRNTASTNRRPQKRKSQWLQTKSHMIFERVFPCLKP